MTTPMTDDATAAERVTDVGASLQLLPDADIRTFPKDALRRVRAVKKIHLEEVELLSGLHKRIHALMLEAMPRFNEIRKKRAAVVNGQHEPTDNECDVLLFHGASEEELKKIVDEAPQGETKGVPGFWLAALLNAVDLEGYITPADVPALQFLEDITCEMHGDPPGYTVLFHFAENPYFSNAVLKKHYELKLEPDVEDPSTYEGPVVESSRGEKIDWREGKDLTLSEVRKKRDAEGNLVRHDLRVSFFTFFDPATKKLVTGEDPVDDLEEMKAIEDFELGEFFRHQLIPRAVLYVTDEALQDDGYSSFDGDEDESLVEEMITIESLVPIAADASQNTGAKKDDDATMES